MKKKFIKYLGLPLLLALTPLTIFAGQTSGMVVSHIGHRAIILVTNEPLNSVVSNGPISYLIGGIIAILIMIYLIYSLIRPEKF